MGESFSFILIFSHQDYESALSSFSRYPRVDTSSSFFSDFSHFHYGMVEISVSLSTDDQVSFKSTSYCDCPIDWNNCSEFESNHSKETISNEFIARMCETFFCSVPDCESYAMGKEGFAAFESGTITRIQFLLNVSYFRSNSSCLSSMWPSLLSVVFAVAK